MTQDNEYIEVERVEPVAVQRTVTEVNPVEYQAVEQDAPRRHSWVWLPALLGLLSLFLPFWTRTGTFVREWLAPNYATGAAHANQGDLLYQRFTEHSSGSFWNLSQGLGSHHTFLLLLLLLAAIIALVASFAGGGASWAAPLAGVLGILSGLYLLWKGFTHGGLGGWLAEAGRAAFGSGIGRWLMILAGLGLLATGIMSLLSKARNAADDAAGAVYNNTGYTN